MYYFVYLLRLCGTGEAPESLNDRPGLELSEIRSPEVRIFFGKYPLRPLL